MTWAIEDEDGVLPSDFSSFAQESTVVIDTGKIWNDQEIIPQSPQPAIGSRGEQCSIVTQSSNERHPSSHRVVSRFFSKYTSRSSLHEGVSAPRTLAAEWEDHSDRGSELSNSDGLVDCHCTAIGCDRSLSRETDSFMGIDYAVDLSGALIMILRIEV